MSEAKKRCNWWDFRSTDEDKAYLKGFEDALEHVLEIVEHTDEGMLQDVKQDVENELRIINNESF